MLTSMVVLVLVGLPSPQFTWSVSSSSGAATLAQTALPDDACSLRCELQGKQAWTQQTCLGRGTDFIFVSDDCATMLVLNEYPLRGERTELTPVGAIATAKGSPAVFALRLVKLEEVLDHKRLRGEGRRVRWLAGVVGEPGVKPHLDAAGTAIEFSTTDGTSRAVRFSNPEDLVARAASLAKSQPAPTGGEGMYQYVGEDGSTQFVTSLSQVPPRFRKRATRVESEISMVKGERMNRPWSPPTGSLMDPVRAPPTVTRPPPKTSSSSPDCVFGLSGAACDAVRNAGRQNNGGLAPRSPAPWGR